MFLHFCRLLSSKTGTSPILQGARECWRQSAISIRLIHGCRPLTHNSSVLVFNGNCLSACCSRRRMLATWERICCVHLISISHRSQRLGPLLLCPKRNSPQQIIC